MRKLSIYSAVILFIMGVFSVSAYSDDIIIPGADVINTLPIVGSGVTRQPARCDNSTLKFTINNSGGDINKSICTSLDSNKLCKPDEPGMSIESFYEVAKEYIKTFNDLELEKYGLENKKPSIDIVYDDSGNQISMKLNNFPGCIKIFENTGGRIPSDASVVDSNVYLPYMRMDQEAARKCVGANKKVKCFLEKTRTDVDKFVNKIFGKETDEFKNRSFDPESFLGNCFDKTTKKVGRKLKRGKEKHADEARGLITSTTVTFDNFNHKQHLPLSTNKLNRNQKVCAVNIIDDYKVAKFYNINSDGKMSLNTGVYAGEDCRSQARSVFSNIPWLRDIESIGLMLNEEAIIKDGEGNGVGLELLGSKSDYENFTCEGTDANSARYRDVSVNDIFKDKKNITKFLERLTKNTNKRYAEFEKAKDYYGANETVEADKRLSQIQESLNPVDDVGYNLDMILGLTKKLSLSRDGSKYIKELWTNYSKLKEMSETTDLSARTRARAVQQVKKDRLGLLACRGLSQLIDPNDCTYSFIKSYKLGKYLESRKSELAGSDEEEDERIKEVLGEDNSAVPKGIESLVDSKEFISKPYTVGDLNFRIKLLKNREDFISQLYADDPDFKVARAKCEDKDKKFDFDKMEKDFFDNGSDDLATTKDTDDDDDDDGDDDSYMKDYLGMLQQQLMMAQGNNQNSFGMGYNNQLYALQQRLNGQTEMMYNILGGQMQSNYSMLGYFQNFQNNTYSMINSVMDYSLGTNMLSNQFNYMYNPTYFQPGSFFSPGYEFSNMGNLNQGFDSFTNQMPNLMDPNFS